MNELREAKRALGFAFTFAVYAVWLGVLAYRRRKRTETDTLAKLIHDGAQKRRPIMMREEFTDGSPN